MDRHHRLQLAHGIHLALTHELGQGIDLQQMLDSELYARDVLLVCQAYPGSELQRLGQRFRLASAQAPLDPALDPALTPRTRAWRSDSSGFGMSNPAAAAAHSGFEHIVDAVRGARHAPRRWLAPSTWFAR